MLGPDAGSDILADTYLLALLAAKADVVETHGSRRGYRGSESLATGVLAEAARRWPLTQMHRDQINRFAVARQTNCNGSAPRCEACLSVPGRAGSAESAPSGRTAYRLSRGTIWFILRRSRLAQDGAVADLKPTNQQAEASSGPISATSSTRLLQVRSPPLWQLLPHVTLHAQLAVPAGQDRRWAELPLDPPSVLQR
jgi:hypothetical protein